MKSLRWWLSILISRWRRLRSTFPWCLNQLISPWGCNCSILLSSTTRCWMKSHRIPSLTHWYTTQSWFDISLSISHISSFSIPFSRISSADDCLKFASPTLRISQLYFFTKLSSCFHVPLIFAMIIFPFLWPLTRLWSTSTSTRLSVMHLMSSACRFRSWFIAWAHWWPKKSSAFLLQSSRVELLNVTSHVTLGSRLHNRSHSSRSSKISALLDFWGPL